MTRWGVIILLVAACGGGGSSRDDAGPRGDASPGVDAPAPDATQPVAIAAPPSALIYVADVNVMGVDELFYVDTQNGVSSARNGSLVADGQVVPSPFGAMAMWSPTGADIAYRADQQVDEQFELFATPASSAGPVRVSAGLTVLGDVDAHYFWSPDGERLVYGADAESEGRTDLYAVDLRGETPGPAMRLTPFEIFGVPPELDTVAWSPDSTRVAFAGPGVHVADLTGGEPQVAQVSSEWGWANSVAWSPEGTRLAYLAEPLFGRIEELYLVDLSTALPGEPIILNGALAPNGAEVESFRWSPDGRSIVYQASQNVLHTWEIYFVDLSGPTPAAPMMINGPLPPDTGLPGVGPSASLIGWTAGGECLVYIADEQSEGVNEVFMVDMRSGTPGPGIRIHASLPSGRTVRSAAISPTGDRVVYVADQLVDNVFELFAVSIVDGEASEPVKVSGPLVTFGDVEGRHTIEWSADGRWLLYLADQDVFDIHELYLVDMSEPGASSPVKVNTALPAGGTILVENWWSSDSSRIAYRADYAGNGRFDLFVSTLSPEGTPSSPQPIHPPLPAGASVKFFRWAP